MEGRLQRTRGSMDQKRFFVEKGPGVKRIFSFKKCHIFTTEESRPGKLTMKSKKIQRLLRSSTFKGKQKKPGKKKENQHDITLEVPSPSGGRKTRDFREVAFLHSG